MDSSTNPNWLVFSLSNHSLFHPSFNSSNSSSSSCADQENGTPTDHHLSVLGGGRPKLEDFLGGPGVAQPQEGINMSDVEIYDDSELKTITAGFLGAFSTDDAQKQLPVVAPPPKKAVETFGQRTSIFRGVTRHRWTGRYEAHLWDNSCRREGQSRKGRQGGYDKEEKAARAYDLAALKYWGPTTTTNFPVSDYEREMEEMKHMTRQEFVASLRRKSSGFSRGASIYRGVTRHHQHGRWQARIGRVAGNKDLYLGTFSNRYDVRSIASSNLPIGGAINKPKTSSQSDNKSIDAVQSNDNNNKDLSSATSVPFPSQTSAPNINFALPMKQDQSSNLWAALGYQSPNTGTSLQGTTPYSMEFQGTSLSAVNSTDETNNEGYFNGCGYYQQQAGSGTTSTSEGTTRDAVVLGGNNGNWILPPTVHSLQAAKPSLSIFHQRPIFGME
ncbi:hypothetical protein DH2020_034317 [Rehmannia glutinosa]|uniref:AP2/ERF domain-containing protein n=1 Tax=Rehmannia glutinosa TaxID=99300 RepID=A0ABR0VBX6_REHGL